MIWLIASILAIQTPDEVRVSSRPYAPQTPYTLRVDTKVVEIAAVVRDSHGKVVDNLTKDDFRVLDDSKTRIIDHFSIEKTPYSTINAPSRKIDEKAPKTEVPRFLALFIDDVNGKDEALGADLKRTQTAAERFVKDALKSGVRIGVFTTSGEPKLDFTTDQATLNEAIRSIKPHIKMRESGLTLCPRVTPYAAYKIAVDHDRSAMRSVLYDSGQKNCPTSQQSVMAQAEETWRQVKQISTDTLISISNVVEYLGTRPGRREMIMASSGFLAISMQQQRDQVVERALREGVVISALDSKGLFGEAPAGLRPQDPVGYCCGPGSQNAAARNQTYETVELPVRIDTINEPMADLAEGTGGTFFRNNNDLNAGFRKLGTPPEVTYRFIFQPDDVTDGSYHKLKVTVKGYTVEARPGYFAPKGKVESLEGKLDREVNATDTVADFPIGIALEKGTSAVSVIVSVDISKLKFAKQDDRQTLRIVFVSALLDDGGKIVAAKEGVMDFALTEATFKRLEATGVNAKVTLQAPPGSYKLRQVAEEVLEGKVACSTHSVLIR